MIQVGTNSEIIFGGQPTGYGVSQEDNATRVYPLDGSRSGIGMPRSRYSLSHDMPSSGVAGRAEFERDFCAVTGREIPESTLAKLKGFEPLDVLLRYPTKALVSEFYDIDQEFGDALTHLFGASFEYPDFSHRTVGAVVKMAVTKLEQSGLDGAAKSPVSMGEKHDANRIAYVDRILAKYQAGEDNAYEAYKRVYGASHNQSADESDLEYVKRCAEQDFEDAELGAAVYQEIADELVPRVAAMRETGHQVSENSDKSKLAADLLSGHPDEALSTWTKEASSAALAEGWCLSECSGNSVEIQCQKVDSPEDSAAELGFTPPTLEDDGVAFSLLVGGVAPHHVLARQILEEYSPKEWSHICQVVAKINVDALEKSRLSADDIAREKGPYAFVDAKIDQSLLGKVLAVTGSHVVLSLGRSAAIVAQSDLSRVPVMGEDATIVFKDGKGVVADEARFKGADKGR